MIFDIFGVFVFAVVTQFGISAVVVRLKLV